MRKRGERVRVGLGTCVEERETNKVFIYLYHSGKERERAGLPEASKPVVRSGTTLEFQINAKCE